MLFFFFAAVEYLKKVEYLFTIHKNITFYFRSEIQKCVRVYVWSVLCAMLMISVIFELIITDLPDGNVNNQIRCGRGQRVMEHQEKIKKFVI